MILTEQDQKDYSEHGRYWNEFAKLLGWTLAGFTRGESASFHTGPVVCGGRQYLHLNRDQAEDILNIRNKHD